MKVLILNDTSNYHNGCKQVMNFIYSKMENYEVVSFSIKNIRSNENLLKDIDVLIINGEGTMHDNAIRAEELLSVGKLAKKSYNIKTFLINSVWQRNNRRVTKDYLRYFDYISVREIFSKNEIKKYIDKDVIINLDLSYYAEVPFKQFPKKQIIQWNKEKSQQIKVFNSMYEASKELNIKHCGISQCCNYYKYDDNTRPSCYKAKTYKGFVFTFC